MFAEFIHGTDRFAAEFVNALRYSINRCFQLAVLGFKEFVQLHKTVAGNIPVKLTCFNIQHHFIRQDS